MHSNLRELIDANIDVPFVVEIDPDDISIPGQDAIIRYMGNELRYPYPDYTFDWRIKTERGTLAKRISSWLYQRHAIKLDSQSRAQIGNIVDRYRLYRNAFYFKFDTGLFWEIGEFGDAESCYWQSKNHMRAYLNGSGRVYTMKIYDDPLMKKKWGRALLIMDCPDEESILCINAYPKGFQVTNAGRILVKFGALNNIPLQSKYVGLTYRGTWKDYIWINGGNAALVTKENSPVLNEKSLDLSFYLNFFKCMSCGYDLHSRRGVPVGPQRSAIGYVCSNCYEKHFARCHFCLSTEMKSNLIYHEEFKISICHNCASNIRHCYRCNQPFLISKHNKAAQLWHIDTAHKSTGKFLPILGYTCASCVSYYQQDWDRHPSPVKSMYIEMYSHGPDDQNLYYVGDWTSSKMKPIAQTTLRIRNLLYEQTKIETDQTKTDLRE